MYKKICFFVLTVFFFTAVSGMAQTPPSHNKVLYQDDLQSAGTKDIGVVTNTAGAFVSGQGWQTTGSNSQLKINLKHYLPFEGTMQVKVKNLDPVNQVKDDWTIMSIWSDEAAQYKTANATTGSYIFIKCEDNNPALLSGTRAAWKAVYTPFYGTDNMKVKNTPLVTWDKTKEYTFKFVWNPKNIWVQVFLGSTQVLSIVDSFKDQIENFSWIYLGKSNDYEAMAGPIFTELKILGPESNYQFIDVSRNSPLAADKLYGDQGISIADINSDRFDDIYINFTNTTSAQVNQLYMNSETGAFTEQAASMGLNLAEYSNASLYADFNKDGNLDVFISTANSQNKLFINNGSNVFADQTSSRGLSTATINTANALALDIDNDGDLDLFVANVTGAHELYVNQGDGNFIADASRLSGAPTGAVVSAIAGDVDGDGWVDIYITQRNAPCGLMINNKNGSFTNEAADRNAHFGSGVKANSSTFFDYDNDGDLDIFVAISSTSSTLSPATEVLNNQGDGNFNRVTNTINIALESYGVVAGDIDNDGFQDLYAVKNNRRDAVSDHSSRLYRNRGNGAFTELTGTGAEAIYADGRGSVFLDYDMDGKLDLYGAAKGNMYNGVSYTTLSFGRNHLYRNVTDNSNNYIKVAIKNQQGKIVGIGAKIWVYEANKINQSDYLLGYRNVYTVSGYNCQESLVQHFGVGTNSAVDIVIQLPGETPRNYEGIAVNQLFEINPQMVVPDHISVTGDQQSGVVGQNLASPIVVQVLDENSDPAPGADVVFTVTSGGGSLDNSSDIQKTVTSDQNGAAQVIWKMGTTANTANILTYSVQYNGAHLQGSPGTINITPTVANPAIITKQSGDAQSGYISQPLTTPLVVRVTDQYQNVIANHAVIFTITTGDGAINQTGTSTLQVLTDSQGQAQVEWLLGSTPGAQTLTVTSVYNSAPLQNSPLVFTATAEPPQQKIVYQSGNYQTKAINSTLDPFRVKISDYTDAPVAGHTVQFKVISGNGNFGGQNAVNVQTDDQGIASAAATLGTTAGDTIYVFHAASAGASGSPVIFKASATGGAAAELKQVAASNNQTGIVNRTLPTPFQAQVVDAFNNPVTDVQVTFSVTKGEGKINNTNTVNVITNNNGIASAYLKLDDTAGENIVVASVDGLTGSPVTFFANGIAAAPARIDYVSGNNQSGSQGLPLALPFVVVVRDSFLNTISGHNVNFKVTEGGGLIDGLAEITKITNEVGRASANLTLGTTAYTNLVEARSFNNGAPLINSPLIFLASTGPGDPARLVYDSGNNQTGRVSAALPLPFKVKVTDDKGIPIKGHEVEFISYTPGAHFSGENTVTKRTDKDGYVSATATLGSNYVDYQFEAVAKFNGVSLTGSPIQFIATGRKSTATQIVNISKANLSGTAGRVVADSLKIKVLDANLAPVANHPVEFQVTSGAGSLLNNTYTNLSVNSDQYGIARVSLKLRNTPGIATVRATSDNGLPDGELQGSPIDFSITAITGAPDPATCLMNATTNILANGTSKSNITVTLRDAFNNPVADKNVILQTAGIDVIVTQPAEVTNQNGIATGSITSLNVGQVTVWAMVENQMMCRDTVTFITGAPAIVSLSGTGQFAVAGKQLPEQVGVLVQDSYNHPVQDIQVTFSVTDGGGSITETQPVKTNADGRALVHWTLGPVIGIQHLNAVVNGIAGNHEITAIAMAPSLANITKVSADSLLGLIDQDFSFTVAIIDTLDSPIVNYDVDFELILGTGEGQGQFTSPVSIPTNNNGRATAVFRSGTLSGLHKIRASAGAYGSVVFDFIVEANRSITLSKTTGDGSTVRPNSPVNVGALALNAWGKPVNAEKINFAVIRGDGVLDKTQPVLTNDQGIATVKWTVKYETGMHQLQASPHEAEGSPVLFTAVVVNTAPVFNPLPEQVSITCGNTYSQNISATDADQDPLTFGVRGLPAFADFDSTLSHTFFWQPDASQKGDHQVTFITKDPYGAADTTSINFTVIVENRCPVITYFEPQDTLSMPVSQDDYTVFFKVSTYDPDRDPLTFEWRVNDIYNGSDSVLTIPFKKEFFPDPYNVVQVIVSDGSCEKCIRWSVFLTAIELNNLAAVAGKEGVEVIWQTNSETGNLGFNILKSKLENGVYEKINESLIKPSADRNYSFKDNDAKAGVKYYYKLQDISSSGFVTEHGPVMAQVPLPEKITLGQNYPNPFNPVTTISFELPSPGYVALSIFNYNGQLVRTLADNQFEAGYHKLIWDSRNELGLLVPSGVYFYRMKTGEYCNTKKLLLLK